MCIYVAKIKNRWFIFSHLHVCIFIYVYIFCCKQLCDMLGNAQDKYIDVMIFSLMWVYVGSTSHDTVIVV
jgi:hypothetical protein